jgi:hypothetical protein
MYFAPSVAKPKAKTASNDISTLHRVTRCGNVGQAHVFRPLPEGGTSPNAHGTTGRDTGPAGMSAGGRSPGPSWNFCKVPVFSPGREQPFQTPPHFSARRLPIQAKLKVGAVNDPLEIEADRIAEQVMRIPAPGVSTVATPQISRKCATCEDEEKLQKKPAGPQTAAGEAPASVHNVLRSPGRPLDSASQAFFTLRFGHDFSKVRIHDDAQGAASARSIGAIAYTVNHNIVFGNGQYAPATVEGAKLIAHELTHVVQQRSVRPLDAKVARGPEISTSPISLVSRKAPPARKQEQKQEAQKNQKVNWHLEQLRHVADFLDNARKLKPDPKKALRDPDNLFRNTVELLDRGKLTLTVLSPTHYSPNVHFDSRVKFDSLSSHPTTAPNYPADPKDHDAGLVFDDKEYFGTVKPDDIPEPPQTTSEKVEHTPARVEYKTGKNEPALTKIEPAPTKTSGQPPAAHPFLPGDILLFTRGIEITEDGFKNTFVHEGQHVADLSPRPKTVHSANELLEGYKSEFRAFWIQPPLPRVDLRGQQAIDLLPEPKGSADNSRRVTISQPEHCKVCPAPNPSAKAGKGAFAEPKTDMKNPRQEAIFWHILSHYQDLQYDCCYIYDQHFHDEVNKFAYPQSVNLINSDRLMNLNLDMRKLKKSMTPSQVSSTDFIHLLTQLESLDWVFLRDPLSKPLWEALAIAAPDFLYKGVKALVEKGIKSPVSTADVNKALSEK